VTAHQYLFAAGPYVAAALCVVQGLVQMRRRTPRNVEPAAGATLIGRWALAVVLAGHVLAFAFPSAVLAWNRQAGRLYALEVSGLMAAALALAGLGAALAQRVQAARTRTRLDTVGETLAFLALTTGAATALSYRWASSWAAVTLAPYLASVLRLEPDVTLVAGMPALIRLHVLSGLAIVAVLPHTPLARVVVLPWHGIARLALVPLLRPFVPLWRAFESWILTRTRSLQAVSIRDRGEEN
jgi:nitrate reductase gamma subunit